MEGEGRRKQVNYEQLVALLEFLKEHEDLAKGLTRGRHRRGKFHIVKAWNLCSKKLNGLKDGAVKDGKGWSKYWCDWKYRAKRRALELKAAKDGDKPLPEGMLPLSAMEEDILNLIGQSAVEDVVIMNDPLSEEGLDEAIQNYTDNNEDSPINQYFESEDGEPLTKSRKRRQPCHDDDEAGPSSPLERKPTLETTTSGSKKNSKVEKRSSKRRRKERSPINSDMEMGGSCSPLERKPEVVAKKNGTDCVDSDVEDKASAFLSIEREKVFSTGKIINTLEMIHTEISRLTSVMADIKDYLVTNYRQISVT